MRAAPIFAERVEDAAGAARRATAALRGRGLDRVALDAAPLIARAAPGLRFLAAAPHRALALGAPFGQCPAEAVASAATPRAAAGSALTTCLAQSGPDCGCVLLALDDALFAPRAALAYAQGVAATLLGRDAPDGLLVAEERAAPDGRAIRLRDAGGALGEGFASPGGAARLSLNGRRYQGRWRGFGRLRGRLVERWRLTGPQGEALSLLIGFEPGAL